MDPRVLTIRDEVTLGGIRWTARASAQETTRDDLETNIAVFFSRRYSPHTDRCMTLHPLQEQVYEWVSKSYWLTHDTHAESLADSPLVINLTIASVLSLNTKVRERSLTEAAGRQRQPERLEVAGKARQELFSALTG